MKWLKHLWHGKPDGAFVEVHLDYGFGRIEAAAGERPFKPCLHITDLTLAQAKKALHGKRFDWHSSTAPGCAPFSHWRHYLELEGFHTATWAEVQKYLKEE